jgi:nicotinamide-nucleotide amidase
MTMADDTISRLAELARDRGLRIAVAESLTSGALASRIGAGERASEWFAGSIVAYQMQSKGDVLDVPQDIDPCSAECAELLASGALRLFGADIAVATTGVGGPDPQDGHDPGTVYLGWAVSDAVGHLEQDFSGEPKEVLDQTVDAAVSLLLDRLPEG